MNQNDSAPFTQTVDVETPELVVLTYTVAGLGSRVYAALIDLICCFVLMISVIVLGAMLVAKLGTTVPGAARLATTAWMLAAIGLLQFAVMWGYYVLFEGFADGQTPGKRLHQLRVVRDGGYSVGFAASAVRNLMRIVDMMPLPTYFFGIVGLVISKSGKRLGDVVAGTLVVREQLVATPVAAKRLRVDTGRPEPVAAAVLTDAQYRLLERWLDRRDQVDPVRRTHLTERVASRLGAAVPADDAPLGARLIRLFEVEKAARERGVIATTETGAGRERFAIVAAHSARWAKFATTLATAKQDGLASLGEERVRDFVADYRSLSADLARLRTATRGVATDELFYLGRLVSTAHNLIYRDRASDLLDVARFLAFDVPREIRRSYAPIALAGVLLFGPAAIAYTAVVRHPEVARTFIPTSMQARAEDGIKRAKAGTGYIEDPQLFRPLMASKIISNNVQVTFAAFGLGATFGLGTANLLLFNGVSLGGVLGLYVSKGIGPLIVAFVAPHGVLELAAICIAGGAGFLIAAAMLLPGNRTRKRALRENSVRAVTLIGGTTIMLLIAGTIEGLVSPIPYWPLSLKLCFSALTAVALYLWLRTGAGTRRTTAMEARGL
jgi:uncharacterized membrane protein SpoIIM required for sporulation/uncharacterized RDD family membrane protein YckC